MIKKLREKSKMTQKDFAEYFKIPVRTLQDWEHGRRKPAEYLVELIKYKAEKERLGMLKGKYEIKFEELEKENLYKYFLVGSPTDLRTVKVVEGDTLKEIWDKLWEMNEIDKDLYWEDNEIFDEEKEVYYVEDPENYETAIEEYLKDSNNFYYKKCNW